MTEKKKIKVVRGCGGVYPLVECLGDTNLDEGTFYYADQHGHDVKIRETGEVIFAERGIKCPYPIEKRTYVYQGKLWLLNGTMPRPEYWEYEFIN